jgi:hypothetical protein
VVVVTLLIRGGDVRRLRTDLPRRDTKRLRMGLAIVLGQDLAEAARAIRDRSLADPAACDRKVGNGDGEAAGL